MKLKTVLAGLGVVCALGALAGCGGNSQPEQRDSSDQITQAGQVDAFSVHIGDCLISNSLDSTFTNVPGVPCSDPHDSEVIYIFSMPDGTFDQDAIDSAAEDECPTQMASYVGPNWDTALDGNITYTYFTPTSESWSQGGDREVDCLAATNSGTNDWTSSVKGVGA